MDAPAQLLRQIHQRLRKSLVGQDGCAIAQGAGGHAARKIAGDEDVRLDAGARQMLIYRARGKHIGGLQPFIHQRVANLVARVGEHQRRDDAVKLVAVLMPLIHAALRRRQAGVYGGGVRAGGRWKHRRDLRHSAFFQHVLQEWVALQARLDESPAQSIHEEQHHAFMAAGQGAEHVRRHAQIAIASQHMLRQRRQIAEAVAVVQRPDERPAPAGGIHCGNRGGVEHSQSIASTHLAPLHLNPFPRRADFAMARRRKRSTMLTFIEMRLITSTRHDTSASDKQVVSSRSP